MFIVHDLYSTKHEKIYIGHTSDLSKRMTSHNETGSGYTSRYRPWEVIYTEEYEEHGAAMKREKNLKGGQGREWIKNNLL